MRYNRVIPLLAVLQACSGTPASAPVDVGDAQAVDAFDRVEEDTSSAGDAVEDPGPTFGFDAVGLEVLDDSEDGDVSPDGAADAEPTGVIDSIDDILVDAEPDAAPAPQPCESDDDCEGDAHCVDDACVPFDSCASSKDCTGQVCDTGVGECVDCLEDADCPVGVCSATHSCVVLVPCVSDKDCTDDGMVCDKEAGICVDCLSHADCDDEEHCASNICLPDVCVPAHSTCVDGAVHTCSEAGDGTTAGPACSPGATCVAQEDVATCEPWICTPGPPACDGAVLVTCADDGLSVLESQDCSAAGDACVDGACVALVCEPAAVICAASGLGTLTCAADGLSETAADCPEGTWCDQGECVDQVCVPLEPLCDGNKAVTCNATGSGLAVGGQDCAILTCLNGECVQFVCEGGETVGCLDGHTLEVCALDGKSTAAEPCPEGHWCSDGPAVECLAQVCDPQAPICNGNTATTCDALGSGPVPGGEVCGELVCVDGACAAETCEPGTSWCDEGVLVTCLETQLPDEGNPCEPSSTCTSSTDDTAVCAAWVCTPSELGCWDGVAGTCADDGLEVVDGLNCAELGQICEEGVCAGPPLGAEGNPAPSCLDIMEQQPDADDGVYWLHDGGAGFEAWCDMTTSGGGWTLLMRTVWDPGENAAMYTAYSQFYSLTVGKPDPGAGYRLRGASWQALSTTGEHLVVFIPRLADSGDDCAPLVHMATGGSMQAGPIATTISGAVSDLEIFLGTMLSTTDGGLNPGCTQGNKQGAPWFFGDGGCCFVCPSYKGGYFVSEPHPIADHLDFLPDLNGNMLADVCPGPPFATIDYHGINEFSYYVR